MLDKRFWAKYFEVYDTLNELIPYQELMEDIVEALDVKKGDRILDAGSGTGNLSMKLEKLGAHVVAIDFSEEGQKIHKNKNPKQTEFVLADLTKKLPFPDNYFDKIASNNVLYAIPKEKREGLLKELHRVLNFGGVVVVSNIKKDFKSFIIYKDHIRLSFASIGYIRTFFKMLKFLITTVKIFYYNYLVSRENNVGQYDFFEKDEQLKKLKDAGFINVKNDLPVYSNQGVLNVAYKSNQ